MKKLLILLLSAATLSALSYLCFLDKTKTIQKHILSDLQNEYHKKGLDWVEPKLEGEGIYASRRVILNGIAPNKKALHDATNIPFSKFGIYSYKNQLSLQKEKVVANNNQEIPQELQKRLQKKIEHINKQELEDNTTTNTIEPKTKLTNAEFIAIKTKDGKVKLEGTISSLKTQNELISHAKYLFKDHLDVELSIGEGVKKLPKKSALLALDELSALKYGQFKLVDNNLTFSGYIDKYSKKKRMLAEFSKYLSKDIVAQYNINSPQKPKEPKTKIALDKKATSSKQKLKTQNEQTQALVQKVEKQKTDTRKLTCQEELNSTLKNDKINFLYNSFKIDKHSFKLLDKLSDILKRCNNKAIVIGGYTDSSGDSSYNLHLSQKRADAIKAYLLKKGFKNDKIKAIGYGESNPVASNKTKEGRAKNRRIEFHIVSPDRLSSFHKPALKKKVKTLSKKESNISKKLSIDECQKELQTLFEKDKFYFSLNKKYLSKKSIPLLKRVIKILKSCPKNKIVIKSYTDSIGTKEDNLKLSLKKAKTIKRYLVNAGFSAKDIETIGYGEEFPIADNSTPDGRSKNRRVEIFVEESR